MNITRRMFLRGAVASAAAAVVVTVPIMVKPEKKSIAQVIADNGVSLEEIKSMQKSLDQNGGKVMPEYWSKKMLNEFYDNYSLAINK